VRSRDVFEAVLAPGDLILVRSWRIERLPKHSN
jgi:hypothetical protein